jgi:hypothetical protein
MKEACPILLAVCKLKCYIFLAAIPLHFLKSGTMRGSSQKEGSLTAQNVKRLLELPAKLLRKIEKLSAETGTSVHEIIETGVALFEKRAKVPVGRPARKDRYETLMSDPHKRAIYAEIKEALGERTTASMTPKAITARAVEGGKARAKNLTAAQRKEIARAAGKASAMKRAEAKKKAE